MAPNNKFWNRMAAGYAKSPVSDEASYQHKLKATQALLSPEMKMMEFGCGTGSTAIVHAPFVQEILATDVSGGMLDIAREKTKEAGIENITYLETSMEALDQPEESFDVILGMSILHLLEDKDAALAKVFKLLKPGGRFISSTVCLHEKLIFRILVMLSPIGRALGQLPYLRALKRPELEESIQAAGFELEEVWQPGKGKAVFIIARKPE